MTWADVRKKFTKQREDMSEAEERAFVDACFEAYESEPLAAAFWTPYTAYEDKIGQEFKILYRTDERDCDLCALPQWRIQLADGTEFDAYPEEIIASEQQRLRHAN